MKYNIISIGSQIPGGVTEFEQFTSKISLLEYDIIIITPNIDSFLKYTDDYQGKHCLSDSNSFLLQESFQHWKREISEAFKAGKTVIFNLIDKIEIYIDSGQRTYSGTGRNQKTTRHVNLVNNYDFIPFKINLITASGKSIILDNEPSFSQYWSAFEKYTTFRVIITADNVSPTFKTKSGNKMVGGKLKSKENEGKIIFLPFLNFESDNYIKKNGSKLQWSEEAIKFGKQYIDSIVQLNYSLKSENSITPEPDWAKKNIYILPQEASLRNQIIQVEKKISELDLERNRLLDQLNNEASYRILLYGKGLELEKNIIKILILLGFTAHNYKSSDSEFDVIFQYNEGRFLGEIEGKDNKPISVDKLRQLEMNIAEDLQRDEVSEPAKAVLFGNANRLIDINERKEFFTDKCITAAKRTGTALVRTQDLFFVGQYLNNNNDEIFKMRCREAIFSANGEIVVFPTPEQNQVENKNGA